MYAIVFTLLLAGGPETNAEPVEFWSNARFETVEACVKHLRETGVHAWHSSRRRGAPDAIVQYACREVTQ